jgi:hypothetical protein
VQNQICRSGSKQGMTLKVEFLGKFESTVYPEIPSDHTSGNQLGTFGEITSDKKSQATFL